MRVIIIEDEKPAAQKLRKAILKSDMEIDVVAIIHSIREASDWFSQNPMPDLVFMDIELTDGLCFSLFEKANITCPVIFTTAYDEYWQEAFEYNSIDYLLKPIREEKLEAALGKYDMLKKYFAQNLQQLVQLSHQTPGNGYKKRFLVKRGIDYVSIRVDDIAYFYAAHKLVCMIDNRGQKFILDQSLAEIEKSLDPSQFYRVNRKYLVNMSAIKRIKSYPKSKLQLELEPMITEEIVISQENVTAFKEWMDK
jgi:two-component system, LytTR family, response regulator